MGPTAAHRLQRGIRTVAVPHRVLDESLGHGPPSGQLKMLSRGGFESALSLADFVVHCGLPGMCWAQRFFGGYFANISAVAVLPHPQCTHFGCSKSRIVHTQCLRLQPSGISALSGYIAGNTPASPIISNILFPPFLSKLSPPKFAPMVYANDTANTYMTRALAQGTFQGAPQAGDHRVVTETF